jgi:hypothetical protein
MRLSEGRWFDPTFSQYFLGGIAQSGERQTEVFSKLRYPEAAGSIPASGKRLFLFARLAQSVERRIHKPVFFPKGRKDTSNLFFFGGLAQVVERSIRIRQVAGSMPALSKPWKKEESEKF